VKEGFYLGLLAEGFMGVIAAIGSGATSGFYNGLLFGLLGGLFWAVFRGFLHNIEIETTEWPNQGIWQSAKNALIVGGSLLLYSIMLIISILFVTQLILFVTQLVRAKSAKSLIESLQSWSNLLYAVSITKISLLQDLRIILGLVIPFFGGLYFGGLAFIQHFIIRFTLSIKRYIPWKLARFLDYAADRILLRKVGGGYIFIHRLLLEYFAALGEENYKDFP
jgi:hypothetical protein